MESVVEARREYQYMLYEYTVPEVLNTYIDIYSDIQMPFGKPGQFKSRLEKVEHWDDGTIERHVESVTRECPWFDKIVEACIVSLAQIMSSIKTHSLKNKVDVTVPTTAEFIRKVFKNSAQKLQKSVRVMELEDDDRDEKVYNLITKSINDVIRSYVPLSNIMAKNLSAPPEEQYSEEEDILMRDAAEEKTIITDNEPDVPE